MVRIAGRMFEVPGYWSRPQYRFYIRETGWIVVLRRAPLALGWRSRIEDGPVYRGPFYFGSWWWRPTYRAAHARALKEAMEAPRR